MKNTFLKLCIAAVLCFLSLGSLLHAQAGPKSTQAVVGFALIGADDPFVLAMRDGAKEVIEKAGGTFIVSSYEYDNNMQFSAVVDLVKRKVDVILLNPVDSVSLINAVEDADKAHIPVVCVDGDVPESNVAVAVESDDLEAGRLCAHYVIERFKKQRGKAAGSVVVLEGPPSTSVLNRLKGFYGVIRDYPDIQLLDWKQVSGSRRDGTWIRQDTADCLFATNQLSALGALSFVSASAKTGQKFIVSVDESKEAMQAIQQGSTFVFTVARDPRNMGRIAAESALKLLRHEKVETHVILPVQPVNVGNVEKFLSQPGR